MSREIVFRRVARIEFDEAVAWYEGERAGLGLQFQALVDETLAVIARDPERFHRGRGEARRAVLKRFPYTIHFLNEGQRIVVLAVFHASRDPRQLSERS